MRSWPPARVAESAAAELVRAGGRDAGPSRAEIDSRRVAAGDLFVGIPGTRVDGGAYAVDALAAGAWGVLVTPDRAAEAALAGGPGAILAAPDPVAALGALARAWRRELGCAVIGVTGSTGKTSTKDLLAGMLASHRRVAASRENFNTEIGLPLEVLSAPPDTEVLVLELAMRGAGQIAELAAIAEPDVGLITNIGPVHLEQLGSLAAIARAKAELLDGLPPAGTAIVPAGEPLLDGLVRSDLRVVTFGPGGDVRIRERDGGRLVVDVAGEAVRLELPFTSAHQAHNALAALAAARAVGVRPEGRVEARLSALRGERIDLADGITLINDCYNANPLSMRAALDDLAATAGPRRRVAVLGDMLELGPESPEHHRAAGAHAHAAGVALLVTVGERARAMREGFAGESRATADAEEAARALPPLLRPGDLVLVKASRGVGLERIADALAGPAA